MFLKYFGFDREPFSAKAHASCLWFSDSQLECLDQILQTIQMLKGIILLTGERGVGKSALLRTLSYYSKEDIIIFLLTESRIKFNQYNLLQIICQDLDYKADYAFLSREAQINLLYKYLLEKSFEDRKIVIIVDNADNLDEKLLDDVNLLTKFETNTKKLVQIILVGQPMLLEIIKQARFKELCKKIQLHCEMIPFKTTETEKYIWHNLRVAGFKGKELFSGKAIEKIHKFSGGIPRLINRICLDSITLGYFRQTKKLDIKIIQEVWSESRQNQFKRDQTIVRLFLAKEFQSIVNCFKGWYTEENFSEVLRSERLESNHQGGPYSYILIYLPKDEKIASDRQYYHFLQKLIILVSENSLESNVKCVFDSYKVGILTVDTFLDGAKGFIEKLSSELSKEIELQKLPEDMKILQSLSISSYPLHQVKNLSTVEGKPVVFKTFKVFQKPLI
jgi:type II secretory pathway predicted ATPase ExeA